MYSRVYVGWGGEREGLLIVSEPRDRTGIRAWLPARMVCVWDAWGRGEAMVGSVVGFSMVWWGGSVVVHSTLTILCLSSFTRAVDRRDQHAV